MRGYSEERGQTSLLVFDRKTGTFGHCPVEHSFMGHLPTAAEEGLPRRDRPALPHVATRLAVETAKPHQSPTDKRRSSPTGSLALA